MYKGYLDKCNFSDYMLDYLKSAELHIHNSIDIVLYAPISIYTKLKELKKIRKDMTPSEDEYWRNYCDNAIKSIELAIQYLSEEGIFSVECCEYMESVHDSDSSFDMICATFDDVKEYIRNEWDQLDIDEDDRIWFSVTKWVKNTQGKYEEACSYTCLKEDIIFFSFGYKFSGVKYGDVIDDYIGVENLNIPVPFKPGDIMEFDGFPFGPKCHVLILEVGDNRDCCCVQGLSVFEDGSWSYGAVKHGHVSYSYYPKISYLYDAKPLEGELEEHEMVLKEISALLGGDDDLGRKFWNILFSAEADSTDNGLRKAIQAFQQSEGEE